MSLTSIHVHDVDNRSAHETVWVMGLCNCNGLHVIQKREREKKKKINFRSDYS